MVLSSSRHQHLWRNEPPEGRLFFNKSYDEREGDEEEMATNRMLTSPEELKRLTCLLAKDPAFKNSPSWPMLTEWCATCTATRLVRVKLPEEKKEEMLEVKLEKPLEPREVAQVQKVGNFKQEDNNDLEGCEHVAIEKVEGSENVARKKGKRVRGGRGSRVRRLLAFQLMLTEKKGLPLSRLLTLKEADARYSKREESKRMQEESASPMLKRRSFKAKVEEKEVKVTSVDKEKEEEKCFNMGASTGDSFIFTPRSSQPEVALPNLNTSPQLQLVPTFPCFSSPSYIWVPVPAPTFTSFHQPPQSDLMPGHQWMICGACHSWGTVVVVH